MFHRALTLVTTSLCMVAMSPPARSGTFRDIVDKQLASSASHHVDAGVEVAAIAAGNTGEQDVAIGVDLVVAVFREHRMPPRPMSRARQLFRRAIIGRTDERWPTLSRPRLELHAGGALDLDGDRLQARVGAGTGIGPLGIGLGAIVERAQRDGMTHVAFGGSPELRLRHRRGPREHSPSLGAFLRADVLAGAPDRVSIGIFGMFDAY